MKALSSADPLVASATLKLVNAGWPNDLLILNDLYLQGTIYVDSIAGLRWYLVVLLPAVLQVDHLDSSSPYFGAVIAIAIIGIIAASTSGIITIVHWKKRMMQLTQPIFTITILFGCIMLCVSCLVFMGTNSETNCAARVYVFNIAFAVAYAPLLVKCWRVYSVFVQSWKVNVLFHGAKNKLISVPELALYIMGFISVDLIIMAITLYANGAGGTAPYTVTEKTSNGAYAELTYCGYHKNNAYFYAELCYKGILILTSCVLAYAIRNVADAVAGTKVLAAIVYNTLFIGIIVVAMVRSVSSAELVIVVETIGIVFCVVVCSILLVALVLYQIYYIGDKEAAAEVIDEMFQSRSEIPKVKILFTFIPFLSSLILVRKRLAHRRSRYNK